MLKLRLDELQISADRQRRAFDAPTLMELAQSIERHGLFHPLLVRNDGAKWHLVAGERRIKAIRDYIWGMGAKLRHNGEEFANGEFPCVDLSTADPLAIEEAELSENKERENLTFQEEASAVARVMSLRSRQAAAQGLPAPTVADIALEERGSSEGIHHETVRRQLIIAKHLDVPEVKTAGSLDEAFKALRRREAVQRSEQLAATVGRTFSADLHRLENCDALDWLTQCPADSFDVILTDPPYGMGADEFGDSGGRTDGEHRYADNAKSFTRILDVCQTELFRVAKPQAHLYWFCDIDQFHVAREAFSAGGWWTHRTPLVWHKPASVRVPWPEHGPQRKYELILYAVKGKRPVTRIFPDLVAYPADSNLGHQAQKPVPLFVDLLRRSVQPGDRVLDPFAGTGTIFPAAHELKCVAVGIEKDPASYGIGIRRLEALKAQKELAL